MSPLSAPSVAAVLFPGIDLPDLCESDWTLVTGPAGRLTAFMTNWRDKWVGFERWLAWRQARSMQP